MKRCSKCGIDKPLAEFHPRANRPGGSGVKSRCKACVAAPARERARRWRQEHGEQANEQRRAHRVANLEQERERSRQREKARRKTPEWRAYQARWRSQNQDALAAIMRRHRARYPRKSRPTTDPATLAFLQIIIHDPCAICGSREGIEVDHIEPASCGGTSHWTNLSALCRRCNASKNDRPLLVALLRMATVV